MRGYNDFDRVDSLCVHFVYADEVDFDVLSKVHDHAAVHGTSGVYIDGIDVI